MSGSFSWSRAGDTGGPTSTTSGTSQSGKQVDVAKQTVPIYDQLQRVTDAWNPQSPHCAFQHYFYNRVPADQASQYVMPPGKDPQKWEKAMLARPDPFCVPVLAVGFTDLEKRTNLQNQQVNAYRVRLHEINDKLDKLSNRHNLHTTVKLLEMRERHAKLARRALALAVRIHLLGNRGKLLTPQEELFQRRARELIQRADDPAVFGSLNEAWARIKVLKSSAQSGNATRNSEKPPLDWEKDREQLEKIVRVLSAQQKGITFLAKTLADDTQRVDEELGLVPRKPKQKAIPATTVAPQAFAADVPQRPQQQQLLLQQPQPQQLGQGFGQTAQQGTSMFGQPAQTAQSGQPTLGQSLFGQQQQQPASTGLFGQKYAFGQQPQGSQSSSLFGQTAPPAQSGGLFGNKPMFGLTPSQPTAAATTGLFGNTAQNTAQKPAFGQTNIGGGLFGSSTGSTFGSNTGASNTFGSNNSTNTNTFGQKPAFGQPSQPAIGQQNPQPNTSSTFGQANNSFGQQNNTLGQQQPNAFGQPNQSQPAFGQSTFGQKEPNQSQNQFGQQITFGNTNTFGQQNNGQQNNQQNNSLGQSSFGKPAFGFGK